MTAPGSKKTERPAPERAAVRPTVKMTAPPLWQRIPWPIGRVGAEARQMLFVPPDPWPGNAGRGYRWMRADTPAAWPEPAAAARSTLEPHRFLWLRDLRAAGGEDARQHAQRAIREWIQRFGARPDPVAWQPDFIADRLIHWAGQFDFYGRSAPLSFKAVLFASFARQALVLARALPRLGGDAARLRALRALVTFGAAVPGAKARFHRAIGALLPMLRDWPAHGMVAERNPSAQLAALRDLVDLRALLIAAHFELPPALDMATLRAGRALSALRHGDGGLALFHGGVEEDATLIDVVLSLAGIEALAPGGFSAGYETAAAGDAVLVFDAAAPPRPGLDRVAHAGTLAFEFSSGAARLIVNCGAHRGDDPAWDDAGRLTAAHSTLVLGDRNSSEVVPGGLRRVPRRVAAERHFDEGAAWVAGSHDGYLKRFGVTHHRRLFLDSGGDDLRGEDRLLPAAAGGRAAGGTPFSIRFHLHPDAEIGTPETMDDGTVAVPFGSAASGPWLLIAEHGLAAAVEPSFYLGTGAPRESRQIVLSAHIPDHAGAEARWAIRKMR